MSKTKCIKSTVCFLLDLHFVYNLLGGKPIRRQGSPCPNYPFSTWSALFAGVQFRLRDDTCAGDSGRIERTVTVSVGCSCAKTRG